MKKPIQMSPRLQSYLRSRQENDKKPTTIISKVSMKPRGIFYNSQKAMCSIYSSGIMCYDILKKSKLFDLDYSEHQGGLIDYHSDFLIINYHPAVCNWVTNNSLHKYRGKTFCIVTEIGLYSADLAPVNPKIFDHYLLLDPTIQETHNMHAFPRPLTPCKIPPHLPSTIPIIGSFGFATYGKNWKQIIDLVLEEFDEAILRINVPKATYVPEDMYNFVVNHEIIEPAKQLQQKPMIKFELTFHAFESQQEIVNWCAQNTINVFLYNRPNETGLSAVTDQAIISERPLLVSDNATFRHIHPHLKSFPEIGIRHAIETTQTGVKKMKELWSDEKFLKKFETIFSNCLNVSRCI